MHAGRKKWVSGHRTLMASGIWKYSLGDAHPTMNGLKTSFIKHLEESALDNLLYKQPELRRTKEYLQHH